MTQLEEAKASIRSRATAGSGATRCTCRLYEGKMVQAFDHRAASVVVNREGNLIPPGDSRDQNHLLEEHA